MDIGELVRCTKQLIHSTTHRFAVISWHRLPCMARAISTPATFKQKAPGPRQTRGWYSSLCRIRQISWGTTTSEPTRCLVTIFRRLPSNRTTVRWSRSQQRRAITISSKTETRGMWSSMITTTSLVEARACNDRRPLSSRVTCRLTTWCVTHCRNKIYWVRSIYHHKEAWKLTLSDLSSDRTLCLQEGWTVLLSSVSMTITASQKGKEWYRPQDWRSNKNNNVPHSPQTMQNLINRLNKTISSSKESNQ